MCVLSSVADYFLKTHLKFSVGRFVWSDELYNTSSHQYEDYANRTCAEVRPTQAKQLSLAN